MDESMDGASLAKRSRKRCEWFVLLVLIGGFGCDEAGETKMPQVESEEVFYFPWLRSTPDAFAKGVHAASQEIEAKGHRKYVQLYKDVVSAYGVNHSRSETVRRAYTEVTGRNLKDVIDLSSSSQRIESH